MLVPNKITPRGGLFARLFIWLANSFVFQYQLIRFLFYLDGDNSRLSESVSVNLKIFAYLYIFSYLAKQIDRQSDNQTDKHTSIHTYMHSLRNDNKSIYLFILLKFI